MSSVKSCLRKTATNTTTSKSPTTKTTVRLAEEAQEVVDTTQYVLVDPNDSESEVERGIDVTSRMVSLCTEPKTPMDREKDEATGGLKLR
jgi:hypothetical protein